MKARWWFAATWLAMGAAVWAAEPMNLLLITVDDMSADSVGVFGSRLDGTTPNIDRLAGRGMRFELAHVQVANCKPSRNVMWSGCYPHNTGVEGFYSVRPARRRHLVDVMKQAGYFTAIRGKVTHSTPYHPYGWDLDLTHLPDGKVAHIKDVASYGTSTRQAIAAAKAAGKPFCLMINISDPHKPFYAQDNRTGKTIADPHVPSRVFTPAEVPVPGFLPDDPVIRKELSHYYSSVRRADDCVGRVLEALAESGQAERTAIVFLSDHGMPLPFAKTQLYHASTHTPLIVVWPGVTRAGSVDRQHMVSAVDLLPTLCEMLGIAPPSPMDGRSFAPLLRGEEQAGRDMIFKEYNESASGARNPMRAVQTRQYLYLFNPWSNGQRTMVTATNGTPTWRRMKEMATSDPALARRVELMVHRRVEELYDVQKDPDCLHNLVGQATAQTELDRLRGLLEAWMVKTGDPMLEVFRRRDDAAFREAAMQKLEQESAARRKRGAGNKASGKNKNKSKNKKGQSVGAKKPSAR